MSLRGGAWRRGGSNALYLGDGTAGQTLTTRGTAERPVVAIYNAAGNLLATRPGYRNARDEVVVSWDGQPLETEALSPAERSSRAPDARFRATVPEREEP